jgi:hypothetical protein
MPRVEVADFRQALEVLARRSASFYMRLSASCTAGFQPAPCENRRQDGGGTTARAAAAD